MLNESVTQNTQACSNRKCRAGKKFQNFCPIWCYSMIGYMYNISEDWTALLPCFSFHCLPWNCNQPPGLYFLCKFIKLLIAYVSKGSEEIKLICKYTVNCILFILEGPVIKPKSFTNQVLVLNACPYHWFSLKNKNLSDKVKSVIVLAQGNASPAQTTYQHYDFISIMAWEYTSFR